MSEHASLSSGAAVRYARAVFHLAKDENTLTHVEKDLATLNTALSTSADLREFLHAPLYNRNEQTHAIAALATKMGLSKMLANTLALMAQKRRLGSVPAFIQSLLAMIAKEKGETTIDIATAHKLTSEQTDALTHALQKSVGKGIKLNVITDESLIGGLVIKQGSKMIDSSIKSKLANFHNAMKEI